MRAIGKLAKEFGIKRKGIIQAIYLSDWFDPIHKKYSSVIHFFHKCQRIIEFIPYVWAHRDWDYGFIDRFNLYLHKRLYTGIYEKGHHIANKKHVKGLKTIIALYERLVADDYGAKHLDDFDKKYGRDKDPIFTTKRKMIDGRWHTVLHDPVEDRTTPKEYEQYLKQRRAIYDLQDYLEKQDRKYLLKLIAKYNKNFWD